jgi:hypothetical protein
MPLCFDLIRNGETQPTSLNKLDEEFCQLLGEPVDKVKYVCGWFDYIGFKLTSGRSYDEIEKSIAEDKQRRYDDFEVDFQSGRTRDQHLIEATEWYYGGLQKILNYMREHFTPNSWYGR